MLYELAERFGGKIAVYPMDIIDSLQLDNQKDIALLEDVLRIRHNLKPDKQNIPLLPPINLLVIDFDGVMTDNRVMVDQNGCESVFCHRGDGWGIARLKDAGVKIIVLSTEVNPIVKRRCEKLQIECIHGTEDKILILKKIAQERSISATEIAYIGNDINDLECMKWVGVPLAPADAEPRVRQIALFVTSKNGGDGAVREVCEWILKLGDSE